MADGRVVVEAILDATNVTKQIGSLKSELKGISWDNIKAGDEKAQSLGKAFESAGTACTAKLTAPIVAAGTAAFGVAANYQQSASQIQAALGVSAQEAEHFKDIGATIYEGAWGDSMEDVTDALLTVKENFHDLDDASLQSITESALMLRDTFDMDVSESIRGAENLATAFGISGTEAMDLITVAAQNGLNSTDELGDNLAEYATLFQENGYSAEQMFSVLQAGLDAGAYNLDKVNDLVKEFGIRIADGSVKTAVDELGGSFKTTFDTLQASGASNQEIFTALAGEIANCSTEQEKAAAVSAIFGSQGEDAGFKVIEAMGQAAQSYDDVAGAADRAKEAAGDNFASKLESASRTIMGALEPLGEPLVNIAENVAGLVQAFGEWFSGIGEGGQMAIVTIAGIVAAIGPVLTTVGKIIPAISQIGPAISKIGPAFTAFKTAAGGALTAVKTALGGLSGPVGIVIGIIAALAAAFVGLYNNCEPFRNAVDGLVAALGEAFAPVAQALGDLFNNVLMPALQAFGDFIGNLLAGALTGLAEFISGTIAPALQSFGDFISNTIVPALQQFGEWLGGGIMTGLQALGDVIMNVILPAIQSFAEFLSGAVLSAVQAFADFLGNTWTAISSACTAAFEGLASFFSGLWEGISSTASSIWEGISSTLSGIWEGISSAASSIWEGISSTLSGIWDALSSTASSVWEGISSALSGIWEGISSTASSIWEGISSTLSGIWEGLSSTCSSIWEGVSSTLSSIWDGISSTASTVWEGISSCITDIVDTVGSAIESGFQAACDAGAAAFEWLRGVVEGAMNGIQSIVDSVVGAVSSAFDWISSTASSIGNAIGGFFGISAASEEGPGIPIAPVPVPNPSDLPIEWYAKGGLFNGPSVIGVGEAGTEAVIPLSGADMAPFAAAIGENMSKDTGDTNVNVNVNIEKFVNAAEDDIDKLTDKISVAIQRKITREKRQKGYGYAV